jgi:hypothetical protein
MKPLLLLLALLVVVSARAQSNLVKLVFRGESNVQPGAIVASYDGGYLISGCANSASGPTKQDLLIAKFDHNFNLVWGSIFSTSKNENARSIMETSTHDVVVAYETCDSLLVPNGNFEAMHMVKLDASGHMRWTKSFYQNKYCGSSTVKGISETTGGNYVLFHDPSVLTFGEPVGVLITDTAGNIINDKQIRHASSIDFPVIKKYGNNYMILGSDDIIAISKNSMMYAFCDASGVVRHSARYLNTDDLSNTDISAMPDGNILILGGTSSPPYLSHMLKIDTNGTMIWTKVYSSNGDTVFSNAILGNNRMFLAGYCYIGGHANSNINIITAEIDATGNFLWSKITPVPVGPFKAIYDASENAIVLTGYYYLPPYNGLLARINLSSTLSCNEQAITMNLRNYNMLANFGGTVNDTVNTHSVPIPVFTVSPASNASDSLICGNPSGVGNTNKHLAFEIFPNPLRSGGTLHISADIQGRNAKLELFDIAGRAHYTTMLYKSPAALDMPELPAGVYVARLTQGDQVMVRRLIVVE